jgi:hypothetical protein
MQPRLVVILLYGRAGTFGNTLGLLVIFRAVPRRLRCRVSVGKRLITLTYWTEPCHIHSMTFPKGATQNTRVSAIFWVTAAPMLCFCCKCILRRFDAIIREFADNSPASELEKG